MKRMFFVTAMGISICLTTSTMWGEDGTQSNRMVCDETCKIEFGDSKGGSSTGNTAVPSVKVPGYSVVSPVGRSAVKPISQAPRLDTLSGKTIAVVGTNFMARITHPEIKRLILQH